MTNTMETDSLNLLFRWLKVIAFLLAFALAALYVYKYYRKAPKVNNKEYVISKINGENYLCYKIIR